MGYANDKFWEKNDLLITILPNPITGTALNAYER